MVTYTLQTTIIAFALATASSMAAAPAKPNITWIVGDDCGE